MFPSRRSWSAPSRSGNNPETGTAEPPCSRPSRLAAFRRPRGPHPRAAPSPWARFPQPAAPTGPTPSPPAPAPDPRAGGEARASLLLPPFQSAPAPPHAAPAHAAPGQTLPARNAPCRIPSLPHNAPWPTMLSALHHPCPTPVPAPRRLSLPHNASGPGHFDLHASTTRRLHRTRRPSRTLHVTFFGHRRHTCSRDYPAPPCPSPPQQAPSPDTSIASCLHTLAPPLPRAIATRPHSPVTTSSSWT
ncbi:hypothetical protein ATK36_5427 [Amycolatopsis sulphurea]|uniref:Uncharacterized protein n=1 Tax=Amycolatopsis sulphurea TaxID=76022 RepID=A0A2A9FFR1_9PSEU|nr:hypothetical protein ATK36_5427 [Amycolatopsis sulphurea]